MSNVAELIKESRKIVIKLGSNTISNDQGTVNHQVMHNIVDQLNELIEQGKQVIVVSSGAQVAGIAAINKWKKKGDINYKQALCAIGQVELMNAYKALFADYGIHVGQVLLTKEDFEDKHRNLNIRNVLFTLLDEHVVPIINENDSVSVDEIKIGDNDTLSALVANVWSADLLVLFSDIDGVYTKNPNENDDAEFISEVHSVSELRESIDVNGKSDFGTGGIVTKLHAAEIVNKYGIPMLLVNGKKSDILRKLAEGTERATVFYGEDV